MSTDREAMGPRYRPAIDGYRGLFVVLVMLFHFGVTSLAGGWVGLNHFFTFSGYLIGGILVRQWQREGRVDALAFYLRRARRIVPAVTLLVVAVLLHTLLGGGGDRPRTAGDAFATLTFWQNWNLVARDDQYFDVLAEPSPLRHAWTLGVEEQFYLLVPLLITLVMALRRRWARTGVVLALAVASALWTAHLARSGATGSRLYYGTDVRAQALLVGVAVAMLMAPDRRGRAPRLSRPAAEVVGWVGTILAVATLFVFDETGRWVYESGGMLLLAVLAACMGASALDPRPLTVNRVFGVAPLVHLGQISYGLYLYHWPIALWLPLHSLPLPVAVAVRLILTWVCAVLSYRFLEIPVMRGGFRALVPRSLPARARRLAAPGLVAGLAALSLLLSTAWSGVIGGDPAPRLAAAAAYQAPAQPLRVAVVGSSIAQSLADGFSGRRYPGLEMSAHTRRGSCNPLPLTFRFQGRGEVSEDVVCQAWRDRWPAQVREEGVDVVVSPVEIALVQPLVVDGRTLDPGTPEHDAEVRRTLDALLAQTQAAGARQLQLVGAACHDDPAEVREGVAVDAVRIDPTATNAVVREWASEPARRRDPVSVAYLDLQNALCPGGRYQPRPEGVELYADRIHLTRRGAGVVWTWLAPEILTAWSYRDG